MKNRVVKFKSSDDQNILEIETGHKLVFIKTVDIYTCLGCAFQAKHLVGCHFIPCNHVTRKDLASGIFLDKSDSFDVDKLFGDFESLVFTNNL